MMSGRYTVNNSTGLRLEVMDQELAISPCSFMQFKAGKKLLAMGDIKVWEDLSEDAKGSIQADSVDREKGAGRQGQQVNHE